MDDLCFQFSESLMRKLCVYNNERHDFLIEMVFWKDAKKSHVLESRLNGLLNKCLRTINNHKTLKPRSNSVLHYCHDFW